jgi:hypothetical protein
MEEISISVETSVQISQVTFLLSRHRNQSVVRASACAPDLPTIVLVA